VFVRSLKAFSFKFLSSLTGFYIVYIITAELSLKDAGEYFFFLAIVTALGNIGRLGFDFRAIRLTSALVSGDVKVKNESWKIISTVSTFYSLVLFFSLLVNIFFHIDYYFFIGSLLMSLSLLFGFLYQGLGKVTIMQLFHGALFNALFILFFIVSELASREFSLAYIKEGFIFSWCLVLFIAVVLWLKRYGVTYDFKSLNIFNEIATNRNVLSNNILMMISQWGVPISLGVIISQTDVAVYMLVLKISSFVPLLVIVLNSVITPKLALCIRDSDYVKIKELFLFTILTVLILLIPYMFMVLCYPFEVLTFFGEDYGTSESLVALWVLSVGQCLYAFAGILSIFLNLSGKENNVLRANSISIVCLLILGGIFVYHFGVVGAAIVQSFSSFILTIVLMKYALSLIKSYKR